MLKNLSKHFLQKISFLSVLLLGTFAWSITMVKSGVIYDHGMGFWGANGHDGVWHLALSESLARGTLEIPIFAGQVLQNYHIGFDLIVAALHRLTGVPIVTIYFQIFPPLLAFFIGLGVYKLILEWKKSEKAATLSMFFVYFGGGFGYLIGKGESAFWAQQAISTLVNPPFALSLLMIVWGLTLLLKLEKRGSTIGEILAILCFGLLIEIKVYAGILALLALFISAIFRFINTKKIDFIVIFLSSLILAGFLFIPLNKNSQGLILWQPFWFLETMMALSDRVGWSRFASALATYKSGHIWIKAIPAYALALIIFLLGNMGTRFVWLFVFIRRLKKIDWTHVFLAVIISGGFVIPMLFLQKGTPWNTIQFFYYSLFFSGIVAGIYVSKFGRFLLTIIILLTLPTSIVTLRDVYIPSRPPAKIDTDELSALKFLKSQPEGIVLTYPFDESKAKMAETDPPRPLYVYVSTAYVAAFSGHPTFMEDEINLDITGYNWPARREQILMWYKENNQDKARAFLRDNKIKYIYWLKGQRALLGEGNLAIKNIFENSSVTIYEVAGLPDK